MNKIAGIVAEYNPFHNGHAYQVEQARQHGAQAVVAVMSGHFLQRGEPALADKWRRAGWAVASGVDLVIELPQAIACRSADYFAAGAVRLLNALGLITHLAFGAESSYDTLSPLSRLVPEPATQAALREGLKQGLSYPAALEAAIKKGAPHLAPALRCPNNILALSYLNALRLYAPAIAPLVIPRRQSAYHDRTITGTVASATAIRATLQAQGLAPQLEAVVPSATWQGLQQCQAEHRLHLTTAPLDRVLFYKLRLDKLDGRLPLLGEGLENRLEKAINQTNGWDGLLDFLKSKRYPRTRLARQLTHYLLNTPPELLHRVDREGPPYARVLAFNDTGRQLLHACRKQAGLPLITRVAPHLSAGADPFLAACLRQDVKATDCYDLLADTSAPPCGSRDLTTSPLYLR